MKRCRKILERVESIDAGWEIIEAARSADDEQSGKILSRCEAQRSGVGKYWSGAERQGAGWENIGAVRSDEEFNITHSNK